MSSSSPIPTGATSPSSSASADSKAARHSRAGQEQAWSRRRDRRARGSRWGRRYWTTREVSSSTSLIRRARGRGTGRAGRRRQPPLRPADAAGAAHRRGRLARRAVGDRAAAEAPRGRGAARFPERRQVVAPSPHLEREAEGGGLPVHDDCAGARHGRCAGRPPVDGRRRAGAPRGRARRCRARRRVPRASGARAAFPPRHRRDGGGCGALRDDRPGAARLRRRPRRALADRRPEQDRPPRRAAELRDRTIRAFWP